MPQSVMLEKLNLYGSVKTYRRRQWQPIPVFLPGKSHGQRSLVGCNPWGREELDTAERLHLHFSLSSIGEGNGSPLQCSCLETSRDGGAWWAAIYGVAQGRTQQQQQQHEDLQDLLELTPKKDVLFITGYWNAKVGRQEDKKYLQ